MAANDAVLSKERQYTGDDLAILVPTYNRPEKISELLQSIAAQSLHPGRIIVIDGGKSVQREVDAFKRELPVEYHRCDPPGQIRQRNYGIALLDSATPLVASFDDDIVLEPQAIENILKFWNMSSLDTGAVSFNIINNPPYRHSLIRAIFGMSSARQGRVLKSGYNVATTPVSENLRTQWLSGGATVWKTEILKSNRHREITSRWAICEDVIFSYPIGKKHPLFVCADANVRHEHVYDHQAKQKYFYYGRTITLWRLYFEELHPELSRLYFFWMILGQILARISIGIFTLQFHHIEYAVGQISGAVSGLAALLRGKELLNLLNET